ncbi:MAG: zf-HC2 domain-containing protein [Streptomycetaceae bacterium]|nr:zf-HC2 domain-containing protein [Streptomycetaceae bacterium]
MRERVAAHLATCEQCKAEADEQRRLKEAVAGAVSPALSAGLLARLQGLPGGGPDGPGDDGPFGAGVLGRIRPPTEPAGIHFGPRAGLGGRRGSPRGIGGGFGGLGSEGEADSYLAPCRGSALAPIGERLGGFRIHNIATSTAGVARSASRGRRFAFVAAGAFSMAAIALGGAFAPDATIEGGAAVDGGAAANRVNPVSQESRATVHGVPRATHEVGVPPVSDVQRLLAPQGGYEHDALQLPADGGSPSPLVPAIPLSARSSGHSPRPYSAH